MIGQTPAAEIIHGDPLVEAQESRQSRSYWRESWARLRANRLGMVCMSVIIFFALMAIFSPLISAFITHHDPTRQDLAVTFMQPNAHNWLGTDELGRDTLTRLIFGTRVTLTVAFLAVSLLLLLGGSVGITAGFYGGMVENLLMRFVDMLLSIPAIYLLILLSILQPKIGPVTLSTQQPIGLAIVIAAVGWGGLARLVRAEVLSVKERDFILATRSIGASDFRLMARHLFPNVLAILVVSGSLALGAIILTEAALDFIGLGIVPPTPSWGNMLTNSTSYFYHSLWLVVLPGVSIFVTVLSMNLFGNAVRDAYDPRLK